MGLHNILTVLGAWFFLLALLFHYAMPQGWYLDGTIHNWAPMWIPTTLGLSIFLVGLIGLLRQRAHRHPEAL
jgi:hypothetical protein